MVVAGLEHEGHGHVCARVCRTWPLARRTSALLGSGTCASLRASHSHYRNRLFPCCHLPDPRLLQPLSCLSHFRTFLSTCQRTAEEGDDLVLELQLADTKVLQMIAW